MGQVSAFWFLPLGILAICFLVYFLDVKKHPPYIEKRVNKLQHFSGNCGDGFVFSETTLPCPEPIMKRCFSLFDRCP